MSLSNRSMNTINSLKTYSLIFLAALLLRVLLIWMTPQGNKILDLCIYIDSGQLMSNGINPYNFQDNTQLRQLLRQDNFAFTPFTCSAQDKWDYFASSNLPLALLTFGIIDTISSSYFFYRFSFAFLDSLLSVLIVIFVMRNISFRSQFFGLKNSNLQWLTGITLGVLNPIILLNGTIIAEHKGAAIMLMLAALLTAQSDTKEKRNFFSPVLLGLSIAFIGLGIFLIPLCLWYVCLEEKWQWTRKVFKKAISYLGFVTITVLVCFIPFIPEIFEMMWLRIAGSTGLADYADTNWYPYFSQPYHSSAWRIVYMWLPEGWEVIKKTYLVLFLGLNAYGIWQCKFDVRIITANMLLLFLGVILLDGSLDRINMGLLLIILLVGQSQGEKIKFLILLYWVGGVLDILVAFALQINPHWEALYLSEFKIFESVFVLSFLLFYAVLLIKIALSTKNHSYSIQK